MGKRIKRRKDGRYECKHTVQTASGPKRRSVYGGSQREVTDKLARLVSESLDGLVFDAGNIMVEEYMNRWLADSVDGSVKRRTYESYLPIVGRHVNPALGRIKLEALSPIHVQGLYRVKLDEGHSPTTVEHIHTTLHRALKQAVKWRLIRGNVCEAVSVPKRRSPEMTPLSPEQAKVYLRAAEGDRHEALYVLALTTGMRQGDILGLLWGDVDLSGRVLHVRRSLVTGYGKQTYESPKSAKSRRSISLTRRAVSALSAHRERQREEGLHAEDGPVFCNRVGGPLHPKNLMDRHFRPMLRRAGLPPIRFHDLRHTAATLLLSRGVHPKICSEMLGHANVSITLDVYSHCLPNMQGPATSAMDDLLT